MAKPPITLPQTTDRLEATDRLDAVLWRFLSTIGFAVQPGILLPEGALLHVETHQVVQRLTTHPSGITYVFGDAGSDYPWGLIILHPLLDVGTRVSLHRTGDDARYDEKLVQLWEQFLKWAPSQMNTAHAR